MARDCLVLASLVARHHGPAPVLVSLARAGTPVGAIVAHLLRACMGTTEAAEVPPVAHYSISIVRDRGIDTNALDHILARGHAPQALAFVDGWTGKGVIARELRQALDNFRQNHGVSLDASLFALTDLAGVGVAPSDEDYLIPSSILNATISGLVSRSVLNDQIGPNDFHGCVYYEEFAPADRSVWFVEALLREVRTLLAEGYAPCPSPVDPAPAQRRSADLLTSIRDTFGIDNPNFIKPGIGEATRVLLRQLPERVIICDTEAPEVAHLLQLAHEKGVQWQVDSDLPYHAVSLIQGLSDA